MTNYNKPQKGMDGNLIFSPAQTLKITFQITITFNKSSAKATGKQFKKNPTFCVFT
jgi:hypothetical protein